MAYNGSGTFNITTAGQPVVTGTVISSTAFNALTADLATGLSTAITKDGQTTTTARILFAQGVSSTLVTDATSATTGSIITAGGISMQKALWVGTTATIAGATTMAGITATSLALGGATLGTNALAVTGTTQLNNALNYGGVTLSNAVTGTGSMVLSASPTLTGTPTVYQGTAAAVAPLRFNTVQDASATTWAIGQGNSTTNFYISGYSGGWNDWFSMTQAGVAQFGGKVGIGMTPSNVLDITKTQNSTSTAAIKNASTGTGGAAAYTVFNSSHQATFQLNSTGYSPAGALAADQLYLQTDGAGGMVTVSETGPIVWATGGYPFTERMRLDTSGNLCVGTTSGAGYKMNVVAASGYCSQFTASSGSITTVFANTGSGNQTFCAFYVGATQTGSISSPTGTTTSYNTSSDYRLKKNVQPMIGGLATVAALKPVTYDWISNGSAGEGFIAHELQAVIPEAVTGKKDAVSEDGSINAQGVDFGKIVPHLVAAIQELTTRLAALEK